jgi:hypothetical protein
LLELGPAAHEYLTELIHRRPRRGMQEVEQLHALLQTHGAVATRRAFERGLAARVFGAEYIAHLLAPPDATRTLELFG